MAYFVISLLSLLVLASAKDYTLDFVEKNQQYTEQITIDKKNDVVEIDVPTHAGVEAAKYLTDFNLRLTVMKLDRLKKCYAMDLPANEPTPDEYEQGVKMVNGKFPSQKYWVENMNILPLTELDSTSLSKAINDFCGSYAVVKVKQYNEQEMEKVALAAAKASKIGRSKRRVVTEFIACNTASQLTIAECPGPRLIVKCRFVAAKTCVYRVSCSLGNTGWNCPGAHRYHILHCCDYACKK